MGLSRLDGLCFRPRAYYGSQSLKCPEVLLLQHEDPPRRKLEEPLLDRQRHWSHDLAFVFLLGGVLVAGLWSLKSIPFYEPWWGLDFQNMYAYHTCSAAKNLGLYGASGVECGDVSGRGFIYPPLMFHSFFWVEFFTFRQATVLWIGTIGTSMLLIGGVWAWFDGRFQRSWRFVALVAFWILLMAQFPLVFAMERGNNDIIPVLLWTIAAAFFARSRYRLAGGAMGLAIAAKLYPAIAVLIVAVGTIRMRWRVVVSVVLGGLAAALLAGALWPGDTIRYLTVLAPSVAGHISPLLAYSHPLRALPVAPIVQLLLGVTLVASWATASWRRLAEEPLLIFAGALSISTYFSGISWDYNLITTYPLLLLVTARALAPESSVAWKIASVGSVVAIAAGRGMFTPSGQLLVQIASLVGIAWLVASEGDGTAQ